MLVLVEVSINNIITDFYTGKTYTVQGQYYPRTSNLKQNAKQYKSNAVAENACKKLNQKVGWSGWKFEIINADKI